MPTPFKRVRKLEGERVRMQFDDGREELAVLLCATRDMDGSGHIVYELARPESVDTPSDAPSHSGSEPAGPGPCLYANATNVLSIEPAPIARVA